LGDLLARISVRSDIFDDIVGYDDVKDLFIRALRSYGDGLPVHFLMVGDVATAKTMFLMCLSKLKDSAYVLGSRISRAGLTSLLIEKKPKILCFDEIDKVADKECLAVLLSLMETGYVVETLHNKMRRIKLETLVFAAANDIIDLPRELISRFIVLRFKPYTWRQFLTVAKNILVKREGISSRLASYIASVVWTKIGSKDFRDCIKIARLIKSAGGKAEVKRIIKVLEKYS